MPKIRGDDANYQGQNEHDETDNIPCLAHLVRWPITAQYQRQIPFQIIEALFAHNTDSNEHKKFGDTKSKQT